MPSSVFATLNDPMAGLPEQARIRDVLRDLIDGGADPAAVVEDALAVATMLSIDVAGGARTAIRLLNAGTALATVSPQIQQQVADRRAANGKLNN